MLIAPVSVRVVGVSEARELHFYLCQRLTNIPNYSTILVLKLKKEHKCQTHSKLGKKCQT